MALLLHDKELTELMDCFYVLTKIRVALYDEKCNLLVSYPDANKSLCYNWRKNPEFNKKCIESDKHSFEKCKETKKPYVYECHLGLTEASVPIIENDKVIGYMMLGQVWGNKDKTVLYSYIEAMGGRFDGMNEKIKYRSSKQISAAVKILEAMTEYIRLKGIVQLSGKNMIEPIEHFVDENIREPLSINMLCNEFCVSRTKLYRLMGEYYAGGVYAYIRKRRLEKSKELIKNTDMSIAEIADAVGFSDYNYFLRCFKNEYCISPKNFLKSLK